MDIPDEEMCAIIGMFILLKKRLELTKTRRKRRFKVKPMNRNRHITGQYEYLVKFMHENDHEQFFKYTRLTIKQYENLLQIVTPFLQRTENRYPLSPGFRLTLTLHFLAQGSSMQELAWAYCIGKSTVHYAVCETCQVLWDILTPVYLPKPTENNWKQIMTGFYDRWNMPNCIGAVDGKHIQIQAPKHSGTEFFSYKKSFSLVLMATCDAYYRFTLVDIGGAGSNHDSSIFKESAFGSAILNNHNQLSIPEDINLPNTNTPLPCFLVADQAFPLNKRVMRPYPGENLTEKKHVFNYRLSRARRVIENTFGILVQRWRILRKPIIGSITTCESIVKATVVLHNYVQKTEADMSISERKYCPTGFTDYYDEYGEVHLGAWRQDINLKSVSRLGSNNASKQVQSIRDTLAKYFVTNEGAVPWQYKQIRLGTNPI